MFMLSAATVNGQKAIQPMSYLFNYFLKNPLFVAVVINYFNAWANV